MNARNNEEAKKEEQRAAVDRRSFSANPARFFS